MCFINPLASLNQNGRTVGSRFYSRFPFVFPCPDVLTSMVIMCLTSLFSFVWIPAYVHSDLRASFMSREFQHFLTTKWVATGKTISYNPERNGEAERGSRVLWKHIWLWTSTVWCNIVTLYLFFVMFVEHVGYWFLISLKDEESSVAHSLTYCLCFFSMDTC